MKRTRHPLIPNILRQNAISVKAGHPFIIGKKMMKVMDLEIGDCLMLISNRNNLITLFNSNSLIFEEFINTYFPSGNYDMANVLSYFERYALIKSTIPVEKRLIRVARKFAKLKHFNRLQSEPIQPYHNQFSFNFPKLRELIKGWSKHNGYIMSDCFIIPKQPILLNLYDERYLYKEPVKALFIDPKPKNMEKYYYLNY